MYRSDKLTKLYNFQSTVSAIFCGNSCRYCLKDCTIKKLNVDNLDEFTLKDFFKNYENISHIKFKLR